MSDRYSSELTQLPIISDRKLFDKVLVFTGVMVMVALLTATGGCSRGQAGPFEPLIGGLLPLSPSSVARDLYHPHDPDIRRKALGHMATAYFGGEEVYVERYRQLIHDKTDGTIRAAAVRNLGLFGKPSDVLIFTQKLDKQKEPSDIVRWEAAKAMQKIHHEDAITPLTVSLKPEVELNADVRIAAALALGQYAKPRVVYALITGLNDRDFAVVHSSLHSLVTLTGQQHLGLDSEKWLQWAEDNPGHIFDKQKQYTWKPFQKPKTFFQKAQFWKKRAPLDPKAPTWIEGSRVSSNTTDKPS